MIFLKERAEILFQIRNFFCKKNVLEVETPLLRKATVTDPYIQSIKTVTNEYLQTSPEYAMKKLLSNGSGDIFQISKAFRLEEKGRFHNPEFTILEWYRIDFNHHQLMDEMEELLQLILQKPKAKRFSYEEIFQNHLKINPHVASVKELKKIALKYGFENLDGDKDMWLQLLMSEVIEPKLTGINFIYDYPETQAALAKLRAVSNYKVAERFEVYVDGVELANGFHELQDAEEQKNRFQKDLEKRKSQNLPEAPIDEEFLAALEKGLPNCSGVALGVDRLIMLATKATSIEETGVF